MNEFVSVVSHIDWPAFPSPQGAAALALQYQLEQSQWWSAEQLREAQLEQLTLLLRHAAEHVPLYRERFARCGYEAQGRLTWESFSRLPVLGRADLQERRDDLVSKLPMPHHGRLREGQSSGSTGRPVQFLKTGLTQLFEQALVVRDHRWHERDLLAKHAVIRTTVEKGEWRGWGADIEQLFWTGPSATLNIRAAIDQQARWLRQQKPRYLLTHPSNARALALHCIGKPIAVPRLAEVRVFGEVVPEDLGSIVRTAWNAELTDTYSSEEFGTLALQCGQFRRYHVQSEHVLLEVVDGNGEPVAPHTPGRVLLTNLHNFAMPLIRYEIGDYATRAEPCACGRGLPVLGKILGRARNLVTLPDGSTHWPSFPAEMWTAIAPIRQFRLIQKTAIRIEARLVSARPLNDAEAAALVTALQVKLGYPFEIDIVLVDHIPHNPNAKFEDFVSELV
jgi:phenylacetate-CoA ligase